MGQWEIKETDAKKKKKKNETHTNTQKKINIIK